MKPLVTRYKNGGNISTYRQNITLGTVKIHVLTRYAIYYYNNKRKL